MSKEQNKQIVKPLHISFRVNDSVIELDIIDKSELESQVNNILACADFLEMISEALAIRKKYRNLFKVTEEGITLQMEIENWSNFEKVAVILLSNHPFPTERKDIWPHGVDSDQLRKVIFSKKEELHVIGENLVGLTHKGLHIIEEKLNSLLEGT